MLDLLNEINLVAYIISNVLAIVLLLVALKRPRAARLMFFFVFAGGCITNWNVAIHTPQDYLGFADSSFSVYSRFITGWFSRHIVLVIGSIATAQLAIAIAMLLKGRIYQWGVAGGILFLVSIIPLGIGSAFPCSLIMAIAMVILFSQGQYYLWENTGIRVSSRLSNSAK